MRHFLKGVAHRLVSVPLLGWLVQIVAAVYHLPKIRGQANALWVNSQADKARMQALGAEGHQTQARIALVEGAWSTQLPQVLNVISSGNHRLRQIAREVVEIKDRTKESETTLTSQEARLTSMVMRIAEAELRLAAVERVWSEQMPQVLNVISSGNDQLRYLVRRVVAIENGAAETAANTVSAEARLTDTVTRLARAEQLLADLDSRELRNMLGSLPTSMRRLEREIASRATHEEATLLADRLLAHSAANDTLLGELREELSSRMRLHTSEIATATAESIRSALEEGWSKDAERRSADFRATAETLTKTIADLQGFVNYLGERVEFIRNECMFEMKYGKAVQESRRLKVTPKVLSKDKIEAARQTGLKLNLGCGHISLEGFINVDSRELPGVDLVSEVSSLPFFDGELTQIHSAHLLEHFPEEQLRRELLPYWRRLLRPGGTISAVVPDADAMISRYASGEYPFAHLREVTFGGQDYSGDFHYNMLTPASLGALLLEAGFERPQLVASARANGKCFEFELAAFNPL